MSQRFTKMRMMLTIVAMLAVIVVGAAPALAKAEIAVTGVIEDEQDKADGTPVYGIEDESTSSRVLPIGYLLEGDYSAYVGQRITVYGTPQTEGGARVLDVSRIER